MGERRQRAYATQHIDADAPSARRSASSPSPMLLPHDTDWPKKPVDFTLIWTYLPIGGLFLVLILSTVLYGTQRVSQYVVVTGFVLVALAEVVRDASVSRTRNDDDDGGGAAACGIVDPHREQLNLAPAAVMVFAWFAYGLVFRHDAAADAPFRTAHAQFHVDIIPNIASVFAALVVAFTYWKDMYLRTTLRRAITLFTAALLVYMPTRDTVAFEANWIVLIGKVVAFYLVYIMTEAEARGASIPGDDTFYLSTERKAIQAGWILMATGYILVGSMVQFVYLSWVVYSRKSPLTLDDRAKRDDDFGRVPMRSSPEGASGRIVANNPDRPDLVGPDPEAGVFDSASTYGEDLRANQVWSMPQDHRFSPVVRHQDPPDSPGEHAPVGSGALVVWNGSGAPKVGRTPVRFMPAGAPAQGRPVVPGHSTTPLANHRMPVRFVPASRAVGRGPV